MTSSSDWPTEPQSPQSSRSEPGIDLQRLFFGHKLLLITAIAAGLGFGYLRFTKAIPSYASAAQVLVARDKVAFPIEGATQSAASLDPLDTHIALMTTPVILSRAVEDGKLSELPSMAGSGNAAAVVAGGLTVVRSEQSDEILTLSYRGPNRYDCEKVLNAVISAYIQFVAESQEKLNARTVRLIEDARDGLFADLEEKEQDYAGFRDQSSLMWNGDVGVNIHQMRLTENDAERAALKRERMLIRAELESIDDALKRGLRRDSILMMALNRAPEKELPIEEVQASLLTADGDLSRIPTRVTNRTDETLVAEVSDASVTQALLPLLVQEQKLLQSHGSQHPKVLSLKREIEMTRRVMRDAAQAKIDAFKRAELQRQREQLEQQRLELERRRQAGTDEADLLEPPVEVEPDLLDTYVEARQQELEVIAKKEGYLEDEFATEHEAAKIVSTEVNRNRVLLEDIQRKKRLFDVLMEELQEISLVKDGNYLAVEMIAAPGAGRQVSPVMSDNLTIGGLMGLLAGLGLAFVFELSDRSFRGPEQIVSQLGLPVIGHVPTIGGKKSEKKGSSLDKSLVAYHRPKSRLAESYRAVRVPLLFGAKQEGLKLLQVTSPDPGDGKSTLAANLAIVMANSGKRCLLVDADFRRPKVNKLFGVANDSGLSSVIQDGDELTDAICSSEVENLDLLPTGPKVKNAAELILSAEFASILEIVREKYDFVIVDTPPVLAVTDPAAVASKVDAVLLVLRITKRVQLHASRARETLELIGANILGVVVNGIGEATGYAYGTGVYSSKSSKYQYSNSPYYGRYYGSYSRYGDYYQEKDDEGASTGEPQDRVATSAKQGS